jgi:hypothetical protein
MFSERLFEDILVKYPELIEAKLKFIGRQVNHFGKRIDILFEDRFREKLIIELKKDNLDRKALSQVMEYEGYILSEKDPSARVMLIANRIPLNLKKAMDHHGIEYKEITQKQLLEFIEREDQQLFDLVTQQPQEIKPQKAILKSSNLTMAGKLDNILYAGGTWEELITKAENESKKMDGHIKYSKGVLNAHIKYRTITQKNSEYLKNSIINSSGVFPKDFAPDYAQSRRGKIIELINQGLTDSEILIVIDNLFPLGHFATSNRQAIYGTKRDLARDPNYSKYLKMDDNLHKAMTITGIEFKYEGSISTELTIYQNNSINKISKEIIDKIKTEITQRSPVLMGACRDKPAKNSIGEALKTEHHSPQNLSYVIPLLIEEGFCTASKKKPFIITKINATTT